MRLKVYSIDRRPVQGMGRHARGQIGKDAEDRTMFLISAGEALSPTRSLQLL